MSSYGYMRFPTIYHDYIVFVAEDDLWLVLSEGGRAERLTTGVGRASHPAFSRDGQLLAFVGQEEGPKEIYVMPAMGGPAQRLTYQADAHCRTLGWSLDNTTILYTSSADQFAIDYQVIYAINATGGPPQQQPFGMANAVSFGPNGGVVIGRNISEPAYWKRYHGGRTGHLWCDSDNSGMFRRLLNLNGNIADPCWVGERIYFLSDHEEGIGNIYSCTPQGEELQKHTAQQDFYARHLSTDGQRLIFQTGADLYLFDPTSAEVRHLEVYLPSQRTQLNRRFVPAFNYLDTMALHPKGHAIALTTRGKAFSMSNWEGAVRQHGERDGVRYRFLQWLSDGKHLIAISDAPGHEALTVFDPDTGEHPKELTRIEFGRTVEVSASPKHELVAVANHRQELMLVDVEQEQAVILDHSDYAEIEDLTWSPDGNWLAYSFAIGTYRYAIKLANIETGTTHIVTKPVLRDISPNFDPDGNYLYFVGYRTFNPVMDNLQFEYSFPRGGLPYAIPLRRDMRSPFTAESKLLIEPETQTPQQTGQDSDTQQDESSHNNKETPGNDKGEKKLTIDLDGITDRAIPFPVAEGRYRGIYGIKGKVLLLIAPLRGALTPDEAPSQKWVECFDFDAQRTERLYDNVNDLLLSHDNKTLLYQSRQCLRVLKAGECPRTEYNDTTYTKESGWINLNRIKVSIQPAAEWKQMFAEAWRLQREQCWTEDMSGVDWDAIYKQYAPLVERIGSRSELSDLIHELQGELGTSHARESGGEYRPGPGYRQGFLGIDWTYDVQAQRYRIACIVHGDSSNKDASSPLIAPGIHVQPGDAVIAINGQRAGATCSPQELLVNQALCEVQLTIEPADGAAPYNITVKTLAEERTLRYGEWVEQNRHQVHQQSQGCVGYIHIPDMKAAGYAEFHRSYLQEYDYPALIVDVRWNRGGNVSSLLLEKLARRRIGYKFPRWGQPRPYPREAPRGPMVALTNEHAGSDGDIFSHCFKLLKLGPLVGTRTWGGVIGVAPRHHLVDGTITTQPEYANWFVDVGWDIENYGTDPDIELDVAPQDYVHNADPQLASAVTEALRLLETYPLLEPKPGERPHKGR